MLKKMDLDESGHSEIEVYYPEEEASNETTPINCDEVGQDGHLNKIQILSTHFALITLRKRQLTI